MEKKQWTTPSITQYGTVEDLTQQTTERAWCIPFQRVAGIPKNCGLGDAVSQSIGLDLGS